MNTRQAKLASEIQAICASAVARLAQPTQGLITVTRVNVSIDSRQAKVYLSFLGISPKIRAAHITHLQTELPQIVAQKLSSKFTPHLAIIEDDSTQYAAAISKKIKQL